VKNYSWIGGITPLTLNFGSRRRTMIKFTPWQI